jgi:hypothetical protein
MELLGELLHQLGQIISEQTVYDHNLLYSLAQVDHMKHAQKTKIALLTYTNY